MRVRAAVRRSQIAEAQAWLLYRRYLVEQLEGELDRWGFALADLDATLHEWAEL
jgi:hypothetical protein